MMRGGLVIYTDGWPVNCDEGWPVICDEGVACDM